MPGKVKLDRRVQKTRALLRGALRSLILEKPYDAITVTAILERANVGRSTFYMHFRDKDELLVSGMRELLESARPGVAAQSGSRAERVIGFSLPLFERIEEHRRAGLGRMGTKGWAVLHGRLRRILAGRIADDVREALRSRRPRPQQPPPELLAECVVATFLLTLNWWVESPSRLSARQADAVFRSLILPTLSAALG